MLARANSRPRTSLRNGLAPLEMVMALPILLFIMAVMINFGTLAAWKVRALSVARHAAWSGRRDGLLADDNGVVARAARTTEPEKEYWWQYWRLVGGEINRGSAGNVDALAYSQVDHPVVRGPMIGTIAVNRDLLDPARGAVEGTARMSRDYPLLPKLGDYHLLGKAMLLDNKWQFHDTGQGHNNERRTDEPEGNPLYQLPDFPDLRTPHYNAMMSLCDFWNYERALEVLDREPDFKQYAQNLFLSGGGYPNYHPRVNFCTLDRSDVDERVENLIDRIQGKPKEGDEKEIPNLAQTTTKSFISHYKGILARIDRMKQEIAEGLIPVPPNWGIVLAEVPVIERKITDLEKYQTSLEAAP